MECRIAAAIQLKPDCGCDDKLETAAADAAQSAPVHQHHLKNYTEEFFHTVNVTAAPVRAVVNFVYAPVAEQPVRMRANDVFQPPRI